MTLRGASANEVLEFLRGLSYFTGLKDGCAKRMAASCRFRQVEKGEIIFWQADPAEAAFVVRSGRISIVLNSPDGRELVLEDMHPGELFGELGLLTRQPHSAGAVARSACNLLIIPREAFLAAMDEEPALARAILVLTASRLQLSVNREISLAFMNAHARLARYLLSLEERERERGYVTISQEDLARGTGLIRQTVAKALGQWRRDGWLLTGRGRIVILNRKALEGVERGVTGIPLVSPK